MQVRRQSYMNALSTDKSVAYYPTVDGDKAEVLTPNGWRRGKHYYTRAKLCGITVYS